MRRAGLGIPDTALLAAGFTIVTPEQVRPLAPAQVNGAAVAKRRRPAGR
jgi:hypothetical protein